MSGGSATRDAFVDLEAGFAIAAAPKVGTLSVVHFLFEVRHGRKPAEGEAGHRWAVAAGLAKPVEVARAAGLPVVAVHRDPYERMRSAYQHRVVGEGEARVETFREFCERLEEWRRIPSIAWHTDPQADWLGMGDDGYAATLGLDRLDLLPVILHRLTGRRFPEIAWKHRTQAKPGWEAGLRELLEPWVRADVEAGWTGVTPKVTLEMAEGVERPAVGGRPAWLASGAIQLGRYVDDKRWGWYRQYPGEWMRWVATPEPVRVLEIGAFDGVSANVMLDAVFRHSESCVETIDAYLPDPTTPMVTGKTREDFEENRRRGGHGERIVLHVGPSREVLAGMLAEGRHEAFDVVFVDGGHRAPDVLTDAVLAWPLLKPGGTLIFDDFGWGRERPPHERPREAILAFEQAFAASLIPVWRGGQRMYRKTGVPGGVRTRSGEAFSGRLVIVGTYNSGSSLLSLMMECLGFDIGRPSWGDFGESASLREILVRAFDEKQVVRTMEREALVAELRRWLGRRAGESAALCVKHPLAGLFLPEIEEAWGEDTIFIRIERPIEESIRKLRERQWFPEPERLQRTIRRAVEGFFGAGRSCINVDCQRLVADPSGEIWRLARALGLNVPEALVRLAGGLVR